MSRRLQPSAHALEGISAARLGQARPEQPREVLARALVAKARGLAEQVARFHGVARHAAALVGHHAEGVLRIGIALLRARDQVIERGILRRRAEGDACEECGGDGSNENYSTVILPSLITFAHFAVSLLA